jgi:hypothetical protein
MCGSLEAGGGAGYCSWGEQGEPLYSGTVYTKSMEVKYIKGIVQPFELGGETRLIPSAVKYWKPGKF